MNLSELSKLILVVGISASSVGISIQVMKLLSAITENVKDFRKTVKNLGILAEGLVENQKLITEGIESVLEVIEKIRGIISLLSEKVVQPVTVVFGFLSSISDVIERIKSRYLNR